MDITVAATLIESLTDEATEKLIGYIHVVCECGQSFDIHLKQGTVAYVCPGCGIVGVMEVTLLN